MLPTYTINLLFADKKACVTFLSSYSATVSGKTSLLLDKLEDESLCHEVANTLLSVWGEEYNDMYIYVQTERQATAERLQEALTQVAGHALKSSDSNWERGL